MADLYTRTEILVTELGIKRLKSSHVLIAGVGGVGGHTAECLVRAGVGKITLIDSDNVTPSNLNRQLVALTSTLHKSKVECLKNRLLDINPHCEILALQKLVHPESLEEILQGKIDYIADAIDGVTCKVALIEAACKKNIPLATSLGAGRKLDPTKVTIAPLFKTKVCPLGRAIRKKLSKGDWAKNVLAVYTTEEPLAFGEKEEVSQGRARVTNGTISYMPAIFGCFLSSIIIRDLILPH